MARKVKIIGAGLAGLSAGIYLQQNGIETEIYELAPWAGGVCTAWIRKGHRFDGCIHWMVGTKPGDEFNKLYLEVDALKKDTMIYNAESIQAEIEGVIYNIPLRITEFKAFLHSLSPEDQKKIDDLCMDIDTMAQTKMPIGAPSNLSGLVKILRESRGFLAVSRKYLGLTVEELARPIQSRTLRALLYALMPPEFSAVALVMMLGTRMSGNAGYPLGGASEVIERMEKKYHSLGGKINFNAKVDEILVQEGKAVAVKAKGSLIPADCIIAACDAHDTLKNMLGGEYHHPQLNSLLESAPLFPPLALVSFGLNRKLNIPYSIQYECPEGIQTAPGSFEHSINIRSFDFDPGAAPDNCSSVMVMLSAPLEYWKNLRSRDLNEYHKQKEILSNAVVDAVERRIPGFKEAISVTDVATPATYVRLANLYKASFEGFAPTPSALKINIRKRVPGVKNLVLCGQWTSPGGGICTAIKSGKDAANLVLKELKK